MRIHPIWLSDSDPGVRVSEANADAVQRVSASHASEDRASCLNPALTGPGDAVLRAVVKGKGSSGHESGERSALQRRAGRVVGRQNRVNSHLL